MSDASSIPSSAQFHAAHPLAQKHLGAKTAGPGRSSGRVFRRRLERRLDELLDSVATSGPAKIGELRDAEWLLDNTHVVRQALRQVEVNLPRSFYRSLPHLEEPGGATPRVLAVVRGLLEQSGVPVDLHWLQQDVSAYQTILPLTLGELWALPTLLRVELLDRLCNATADWLREPEVDSEAAGIAADCVAGCIASLREVASFDWHNFVEETSLVEQVLRQDPAGAYTKMDFETRDRYRKAIEKLSHLTETPEVRVAQLAVECAAQRKVSSEYACETHVGFFLIDDGWPELLARLDFRPSLIRRRLTRNAPLKARLYLLAVLVPSLALSGLISAELLSGSVRALLAVPLFLALLIVATGFSSAIINWLVALLVAPKRLPKLDFAAGVPAEWRTAVVIPAMLTARGEIDELMANLEVNYLSNSDSALCYVLLSDFADAAQAEVEEDEALLAYARSAIDELNERHGGSRAPFILFHRSRLWNEGEGCWMGWERKRGKLMEFNAWLRQKQNGTFQLTHGRLGELADIRFVITLDADSRLPSGEAARLVGLLAHPLNRPRFDSHGNNVVGGYTVVQPRLEVNPTSGNQSAFSRIFSGDIGLDLYSHAVSNVYQDLFEVGIFAGKGIYDVEGFCQCIEEKIPENRILSHDLLEGLLGRAALASDLVVLEDYPSNLPAYLRRLHRWIRGDWQLLPWALGPGPSGRIGCWEPGLIGRWQLIDNLRRSLFAPAMLALLLGGWTMLPGNPLWWTLGIIAAPGIPILFGILGALRRDLWRWGTVQSSLHYLAHRIGTDFSRWLFAVAFMPCEAWVTVDAVARTVYRLGISRRRLLEWTPAADVARRVSGHTGVWRDLVAGPIWALLCLGSMILLAFESIASAAPLLVLWSVSPWIARQLGRPRGTRVPQLGTDDIELLRRVARRTWRFFEDYVGPDSAWLPPDNVQYTAGRHIALRTSPTNIGLGLLATESAYQLGYLARDEYLLRVDNMLGALERLSTHRGHLYNWYGLEDLRPLEPRYVSTVDSGNLVACLMALRQGLERSPQDPGLTRMRLGMLDCLGILEQIVDRVIGRSEATKNRDVIDALDAARAALDDEFWPDGLADKVPQRVDRLEAALLESLEADGGSWAAEDIGEFRAWLQRLRLQAGSAERERLQQTTASEPSYLVELKTEISRLVDRLDRLIDRTQFGFLYDSRRHLFHIGYNVSSGELDGSYYDLLASEARIASLVAIGKGDVPVKHWLYLGRPLTRLRGMRMLLSWSGTAFEYLMPRLLLQCPDLGLIHQSCRGAARQQRRYGGSRGIPWGISESGYYEFDQQGVYQYQAFGVPQLGLKRYERERLVVAPYASILALPFEPEGVIDNLNALERLGLVGRRGLFEAVDFGDDGSGRQERPRIVRSYMAHHQGMVIAAICNAVHDDVLVELFHQDPVVAGVEYLLYEELPRRLATEPARRLPEILRAAPSPAATVETWSADEGTELALLSNGHLSTLISNSGGGGLSWNGLGITRWRPDQQGPSGGSVVFFGDTDSGELWGLGSELKDDRLSVRFGAHLADFSENRHQLHIRTQVVIAPQADVEIRRITITNDTDRTRHIRVCHASEVLLGDVANDRRHPAFGKLFVESQFFAEQKTLLSSRRPREPEEEALHLAHAMVVSGDLRVDCHSDRRAFLGRCGSWRRPAALSNAGDSPESPRHSLDPLSALSATIKIPAGSAAQVAFLSAVGRDKHRVLLELDPFRSLGRVAWAIEQARGRSERELHHLKLDSTQVRAAVALLARVIWSHNEWAPVETGSTKAIQQSLWRHGISGDLPIVAVVVSEPEDLSLAKEVLQAQHYWRRNGVAIDVVLLDQSRSSYLQPTHDRLQELVQKHGSDGSHLHTTGRSFIVPGSLIDAAEQREILAAARVLVRASTEPLRHRLLKTTRDRAVPPPFVPRPSAPVQRLPTAPAALPPDLGFANDFGGFSADGREYAIRIAESATPAPWCNILANQSFGTLVSESGSACTWFQNSSEYRLTPWHNDPVLDNSGEALYLRDEETGITWSPWRGPGPKGEPYIVHHGAGYSRFEHNAEGLEQTVTVFVDPVHPVKIVKVQLTNRWERERRLTASYAAEWVLGNDRGPHGRLLLPEHDYSSRALLVRNAFDPVHSERHGFLSSSLDPHGLTTDGQEFLGARHDWRDPPGLSAVGFSDYVGASDCPMAVYQIHLNLAPGESSEFHFALGGAESRAQAVDLALTSRDGDWVASRWEALITHWDELLGRCQVRSPNPALDVMVNRWLPYQVIACRLWGRSGYYQSAGGFGFRDQLQDALSLLPLAPDMVREQILRAAAVQFEEGDVPHWWHEQPLRGVRTRCSDDLLWLPFVTAGYVVFTGDYDLLDAAVPFVTADVLTDDELERYAELEYGSGKGSLYEHCCRAIDARLAVGRHGLPLIGTGDWNDGFDRVGWKGSGESVWLAWFLVVVCERFAVLCDRRQDADRAERYRQKAAALRDSCEQNAWAGEWYLRGYYDDGAPLGHPGDKECRIDLNAQTWAAIAGARPERVRRALQSAADELLDPQHRIAKLLTPAFSKSDRDPGYIKAYPPGVRENGGQYTHASLWAVWALLEIGDVEQALQWLEWLLPLNHTSDRAACDRYRLEPYVLAGDVYGEPPYEGQGGWSWYTGAAGWMYQTIVRRLLGLNVEDGALSLTPCLPSDWQRAEISFRHHEASYHIEIRSAGPAGDYRVLLDGNPCSQPVPLADAGEHRVQLLPAGDKAATL